MAEIFDKTVPGPSEHVLILGVREAFIQPFEATDWTDLRVGFFLSICDDTADDTITGLGPENIGADDRVPIPWTDRFALGLIDSVTGLTFSGYTNAGLTPRAQTEGRSRLLSSDAGIGTSNSDYWRPTNGLSDSRTLRIQDNFIRRASSVAGSQPHFVQNFSGGHAAGYATLLGLRFLRDDPDSRAKIITMQVKKAASGDNSDLIFSSTPTKDILLNQLEAFPTTVQSLGPVELSQVPDTLYAYWPFHGSRLRIHSAGILKVA